MNDQTTVEAGEHTAEELLTRLRAGERLLVQTEVLGSAEQLTLRFDGETYYCDTPTTLHKHDDAEGMEHCMREAGYVRET